MVQIENTVLGNEIFNIIGNPAAEVYNVTHKILLHTVELDIPIRIIESVETLRDYNSNISDYIVATFIMEMGDYIKDVHPFRNNLELSITKNINGIKFRNRYKFVILNNKTGINASRYTRSTREELNKLEQARVIGQCIDITVEALRSQNVSGIYNHTDVGTTINNCMLNAIDSIKVNGVTPKIFFNMIPVHNHRSYQHVMIPTGTKVLDLPTYLQETTYGVYNGNIGTYIQRYNCKNCPEIGLFVYPLYNSETFDTTKKKLIIYGVNSVKYEMTENTYMVDGDLVKIISGGSTRSLDNADNDKLNDGSGYTATDSNLLLERNLTVTPGGVLVDTDKTNTSGIIRTPADGNKLTKYLGPNDNKYKYRSDILKSEMAIFQITWNFANPDLIYPGMAALYNYFDSEAGLVKLKGSVQSLFILENEGTQTVSTVLNIMVEKPYNFTGETTADLIKGIGNKASTKYKEG